MIMAKKIKNTVQCKKNIFFIGPLVMLVCFSACAGSVCYESKTRWPDANLIGPSPPSPINGKTNRGLHLTISKRSSLSIDVECIADWVQRELSAVGDDATLDNNNAWVSWDWNF